MKINKETKRDESRYFIRSTNVMFMRELVMTSVSTQFSSKNVGPYQLRHQKDRYSKVMHRIAECKSD